MLFATYMLHPVAFELEFNWQCFWNEAQVLVITVCWVLLQN